MSQETVLRHVSGDRDYGMCAQDFETTIQSYISLSHLRGMLNFSALWNKVTYIYDTALGDNPNLLHSYWAPPASTDHALYTTFREFVEDGAVRCLVRDKVSVAGADLTLNPTISDLFAGWMYRDRNRPDHFITQRFGDERTRYNRHIDRFLFEDNPGSIVRYDPDIAKPRFREIIRANLANQGVLGKLVSRLPSDQRKQYEQTCNEKEFMTTTDLWILVKDYASGNNTARDLLLIQGYVNQQALADSITAGIAGSDWGHPWRPAPAGHVGGETATPADLLERADLKLTGPAIELLARLSASDIKRLRKIAQDTIFNLSVPEGASSEAVHRITVNAMKAYWSQVCEFLDSEYPQYTRCKSDILGFVEQKLPIVPRFVRDHPWLRKAIEISVDIGVASNAPIPGTTSLLKKTLKRVGYRFLYKPNDAFSQLKKLWNPRAVWAKWPDQ